MNVVLHPRAAPGDRVQVWVGVFGGTDPPVLHWWLDGRNEEPAALRPIQIARPAETVRAGEPRAFTGVYEFQGPDITPATSHRVEVHVNDTDGVVQSTQVRVRTLPGQVPSGFSKWFNVLLVSCFHLAKDRAGRAGNVVAEIAKRERFRPDLTLLLGDQVYLDLPTFGILGGGLRKLAKKFEKDYRLNWTGSSGYARILGAAPTVSIPDDHEYWNNYPHAATVIRQTWTDGGRNNWERAARRMYEAFQLPQPGALGDAVEFDVPPLSFFLMDTRSSRDRDRKFTLSPASLERFRRWVTRVVDSGLFAVIASGQPLLDKAAGKLKGAVADYTLPDYKDYGPIARELARLADGGKQFLLLTGDVHWGRVTKGKDRNLNGRGAGFYEVISSPTSLVATIGKDQVQTIFGGIKSFFGHPDPFPRHGKPKKPPAFLARETLGRRFQCEMLHPQKGNHVAVLSFRQTGFGLELLVTYWPISRDFQIEEPVRVGPLKLSAA